MARMIENVMLAKVDRRTLRYRFKPSPDSAVHIFPPGLFARHHDICPERYRLVGD